MTDEIDLKAPVEGGEGIFVIRGGEAVRGWNGIHYQVGPVGEERRREAAVDERGDDSAGRRGLRPYPRRTSR